MAQVLSNTQRWPYSGRRFARRALDDHHSDGGGPVETPEHILEVITNRIRRLEPGISGHVHQGACPTCGYRFGWYRSGAWARMVTCWSCRKAHRAEKWTLDQRAAA